MVTNFQNSFTGIFIGKFAINIPPYLKCIAALAYLVKIKVKIVTT